MLDIHGRFYFEAAAPSYDLNEKQWPLQPTVKGDQLQVGVVWKRKDPSPLLPGQQILAIDDRDVTHITLCEVLGGSLLPAGVESVVLTVKDAGGAVKKVEIKKE